MPIPLTIKFRFASEDARKADIDYDGTGVVFVPLVGDWIQPDTYGAIAMKITKRIFTMSQHSNEVLLFCE